MGLLDFKSPSPIGLKGLLAQQFDPKQARYAAGSEALLQAGLGILNRDPYAPPTGIAGLIGRGVAGAAQGADKGMADFYENGMRNVQLSELQREYDQRDQQKAAMDKLIPTLPTDIQNFARAYPKEFGEAWMKAQMPGSAEYGANTQWAQDENGNWRLFQPNKGGGGPKEMIAPPGVKWAPQVNFLDTGTGYDPRSTKGGASVGEMIPKDIAGAEKQKVVGKGEGEATVDYKSISSKMPGLEHVVRRLGELSKTATYTSAGQLVDLVIRETGQEPRESAVARAEYIAIVDNQILPMLRDTFGAQFTQKEGESLKVTLGDPNKSPAEKQAVLEAFIEQKRRNIEDMARLAGEQPGASTADPLGIR